MSEDNVLQALVTSTLTEFKALGDYLTENENKPREIGAGLAQRIVAEPDMIYLDAKEELISMQTTFMDNEMVRSNIQLFATRLASLYDVANAMSVELDLSADDTMLLNNIKESVKPFFTIKDGKLHALDREEYDLIRQNFLSKAMDDSTMRANFDAVKVKKI